ncbi:hypothetical protein PRZ61_03585 [Halomonas pacifica]|uniref:hypothetical protein n=1 Tax=Bisbaumannia pacifica TaxID=77098 RepID=UPI0023587D76|nr:hypothetical protein [Halomonas pacifica]MDC8802530.1 hypothetical protein [Halomonas pacifica]
MNLQNQRLYKAFRQIITANEMLEVRREDLEKAIEELEQTKREAALLIQELPAEHIEELTKLPIEASDVTLTISQPSEGNAPVAIDIQPHAPCRQLFEFMEDKKEERTDG